MGVDKRLCNVILLGFGFMFVFTAFQTCGMIQKVVLTSIQNENSNYKGDGYTSLSIIYAVFAVSNWLAPSIISYCGPVFAMFFGGITYGLFVANFLYPVTWILYFASALVGVGAALIWTGQGNYLTINSDSETMARNSGLFWALLQCSLFIGNLFVFFELSGTDDIDKSTRTTIFGVLLGICCFGLLLIMLLKFTNIRDSGTIASSQDDSSALEALIKSFHLLKTKEMLLLLSTFFYSGMELSFFSGVYGACIGFNLRIEDANKYMGMSGIFIGAGEVIGGALFGILGKKTNKYGRDIIVLLGYVIHMITFYLIFINLPAISPIKASYDFAYIRSNVYLALFCSFGLGFADACYNTQLYSIIGVVFSEDNCSAFALFKCVQSVAAAIAFAYSQHLNLPYQLLLLVIFGTLGTATFFPVEWNSYKKAQNQKNSSVNSS